MATIDDAIRLYLHDDTAVASLVHDRIYPEKRPQNGALPAIVYGSDSRPVEDLREHSGLTFTEYSFACIAAQARDAEAIAQAVRARLDGVSNATQSGHTFSARYVSKISGLLPSVDGSESGTHYRTVTIEIAHAT